MNISNHPIGILMKYGRSRITLPLVHFLISPLKAQFVVAYPRSGSTWLRTMLVNILYPNSNSDPKIFNSVIPGCSLMRLRLAYSAPEPRILSTHAVHHGHLKRAVYLMRDGRNCMLSFYRYTTKRSGPDIGFDKWFKFYIKGYYGSRWDQNIISWLGSGRRRMKGNLLVVRYEDFCTDPHAELEKVCDFLDIVCRQQDLERAVEASSIDKMRKWEQKYVGEIQDKNASFYRGSQDNEWNAILSYEQKELFMRKSETALRLGGYI